MDDTMKLKSLEVVRTVGNHEPDATSLKIRIPRLMAKINQPITIENFDTNIFVNDDKCRVYPKNTITTQNYITVQRSVNCDLSHTVKIIDDKSVIPENTQLVCSCIYDTNKITVIDSY